jgi:hypothetical protein
MDVAEDHAVGERPDQGDHADVDERPHEGAGELEGDADHQGRDDAGQVRAEIEDAAGQPDEPLRARRRR